MKHLLFTIASAALITSCSGQAPDMQPGQTSNPRSEFFDTLSKLCGQSFAGRLVSDDAVDADFKTANMVMHVRDCSDTEIRIPFNVDENRSRTWIITKTDNGLRLKHDHRHEDGTDDAVTMYGGDTSNAGTATRQEFPVDDFSIHMFNRDGLNASVVNIWALEVNDGQSYTYEMARPGRLFRVEFDTTKPVDTPPPSW